MRWPEKAYVTKAKRSRSPRIEALNWISMKLLVSWMNELRTYVSREFYYVMRDLIRVHGWRHVEPPVLALGIESAKTTLLNALGEIPETILFWEVFDLCSAMQPALRDLGCRTCLFADDLHQLWGRENLRAGKLLAFSLCDAILCPYAYVFHDFYPELRGHRRIVWIPHSASPDFDVPFNEKPQNSILLSGAGGPSYPLRGRMKDLQEEGRFAIAHLDHPGYQGTFDYAKDPRVGAGYARTLSRYLAGLTDTATFRYIVAKHFEIPAAGSLLMTDAAIGEQLKQLGFAAHVNYLPVTIDTLEEQIQYVLRPESRTVIDEIRRNGQELVRARHRTSNRARLIDESVRPTLSPAPIGGALIP
jgi:Glycosyl transferases group 1